MIAQVINADESEPGTCKDREILRKEVLHLHAQPHTHKLILTHTWRAHSHTTTKDAHNQARMRERTHARTHTRTRERSRARARTHTHACTHARAHSRPDSPGAFGTNPVGLFPARAAVLLTPQR